MPQQKKWEPWMRLRLRLHAKRESSLLAATMAAAQTGLYELAEVLDDAPEAVDLITSVA